MKKAKIGNHKVEYYDSIEELPVVRFQKFNKLLMVDAGVGSTVEDLDTHLHRMAKYIEKGQHDNYNKEIANLRQNFFLILSEVTPKYRAFAALVTKIDGEPVSDLSDTGLAKTAAMLSDCPVGDLDSAVSEVKKKLDSECRSYFPSIFEDSGTKEYYLKLRKWTLLVLEKVQMKISDNYDEINQKINTLADELLLFAKPRAFSGKESAEVEFDKSFDATCMLIAQHLHLDPIGFTVLRFYNALVFVKESLDTEKKRIKK